MGADSLAVGAWCVQIFRLPDEQSRLRVMDDLQATFGDDIVLMGSDDGTDHFVVVESRHDAAETASIRHHVAIIEPRSELEHSSSAGALHDLGTAG